MSTNTNPTPSPAPSPSPDPQPKKKKAKPRALADILQEWESMISAFDDHATELAPIDPHRVALAESILKVRAAKAVQDSHRGSRQAATQKLNAVVAEGQDRAIRMRRAVGAQLGPGTEQLVQFGIQPLRGRQARPAPTPTAAPAVKPELPTAGTPAKESA